MDVLAVYVSRSSSATCVVRITQNGSARHGVIARWQGKAWLGSLAHSKLPIQHVRNVFSSQAESRLRNGMKSVKSCNITADVGSASMNVRNWHNYSQFKSPSCADFTHHGRSLLCVIFSSSLILFSCYTYIF